MASVTLGGPRAAFFAADRFAVVGASTDRTKYGNKVLRWYQSRDLPVTPINPKEAQVEGLDAVKALQDLPSDKGKTSISVITPPKVSLQVLKDAFSTAHVSHVWLQPGAEDDQVRRYVADELDDAQKERVTFGGPCVLVLGDSLLKDAKNGKL